MMKPDPKSLKAAIEAALRPTTVKELQQLVEIDVAIALATCRTAGLTFIPEGEKEPAIDSEAFAAVLRHVGFTRDGERRRRAIDALGAALPTLLGIDDPEAGADPGFTVPPGIDPS